jgi:hypothetical protein
MAAVTTITGTDARADAGLASLERAIAPNRCGVLAHPVYDALSSLARVRVFMQSHVFAVWDFMSLLKTLQQELTCVNVPWVPVGSVTSRRLINEIVLGEESDEVGGTYRSHFELYLDSMTQAGADRRPIDAFVAAVCDGASVPEALAGCGAPAAATTFVASTWDIIEHAPLHCQAAAFAFGREDLIPDMFERVVRIPDPDDMLTVFKDYLIRHIEIDGDLHTPLAMRMLADLCGDDETKWNECVQAAGTALSARADLWTAIVRDFRGR